MPIEIIFELEDRSGDKSSTSVKVEDGHAAGTLEGFAVAWANAIDNFLAGVIRSAVAYIMGDISGLTSNTITETADVEHYGKFEFLTVDGNNVKVNIPCIAEGVVGAFTSDSLDLADPEVAAFVTAMEVGIAVTGGTITPCDIAENDIVDTAFAREAFSNSGARR